MGRKRKAGGDEGDGAAPAAPDPAVAGRNFTGGQMWGTVGVDPDVVELCDAFHIDEFHTKKLHETMMNRKDSFEEDMLRLWTDLEEARSPNGLLIHHMRQMEEGTFVGQCKPDPEMTHLIKKYKLDAEATKRLTDCVCRHTPEKRQKYYMELELHLDLSSKPSAAAMMLLRKIKDGESLGEPSSKGGGKGSGKRDEGGRDSYRDRDDRDRGYDRDRDRGRDDRDRGRGGYDDRDRGRDRDRDRRDDWGSRGSSGREGRTDW